MKFDLRITAVVSADNMVAKGKFGNHINEELNAILVDLLAIYLDGPLPR